MTRPEPHTIVVGGGVIGVCCAYFLAKRGSRVTVLEREEIGSGASYGNAGTISPGHPPINRPVPAVADGPATGQPGCSVPVRSYR